MIIKEIPGGGGGTAHRAPLPLSSPIFYGPVKVPCQLDIWKQQQAELFYQKNCS